MTLFLIGHTFKYELEATCKLFLPAMRFCFLYEDAVTDDDWIRTQRIQTEDGITLLLSLCMKDARADASETLDADASESAQEHALCLMLYRALQTQTGITPKWGMMTGIRPVKMLLQQVKQGKTMEEAADALGQTYLVSEEKRALTLATARVQAPMFSHLSPDVVSLYISIPFCPTRCSYCSFVSHSIASAKKLIPDYIRCLCKELVILATLMRDLHLTLDTIYIGGGTPTSLEADQLQTLMACVKENFHLSGLREYTVEAGRPDTITEEKLRVIRAYGATRISINPQTLNDAVLREIGRQHTAQQAIDVFGLARTLGFDNINMDLIAGLPTDTPESFRDTVDRICALDPESITVHTLTLKRAATLFPDGKRQIANPACEMVDYSIRTIQERGWRPYYLYRQKNTVDNLENVGYAKPGKESFYNILIMEENQTILGAGCAASTKLCTPDGKLIRIHNHKFPYEYINRFDALMTKKQEIYERLGDLHHDQP